MPKKNFVLFFDVETSGLLPPHSSSMVLNQDTLPSFPHILQLSFILFNMISRKVEFHGDYYIKPPVNVVVPPIVTQLTGITRDLCDEKGICIRNALVEFNTLYLQSDTIISHNMEFDRKMIQVELMRNTDAFVGHPNESVLQMFNPIYDNWRGIDHFCTMKTSVDLCNIMIPRKNGTGMYKKWPTLKELYFHLFGQTPKNMHNSIVDTLVGLRCYLKIRHDLDMTDSEFDYLMYRYVDDRKELV